jgi:hypothetical protein
MVLTLDQILNLVGKLDDTQSEDPSRERFRRHLSDYVKDAGQLRDYIEECLRKAGDQYNRALQDLVNYVGHLLEFEVTYGRYHGVAGEIGFDGHWKSPTGFHIVVEVKTTEAYAIKAATLVGYVDALISEKTIPDWERAMGLYVVGRPDPDVRQLENAITAERRTDHLRVISVESLLSLGEMMNEYDVGHKDVLGVLRPSGPTIDPLVDLISGVVAQAKVEDKAGPVEVPPVQVDSGHKPVYWLTPVSSEGDQTAQDTIKLLVGQHKAYAWSARTPGLKELKAGDWLCFYATATGVVAHAKVHTRPVEQPHPKVKNPDKYNWSFQLESPKLYLDNPVVIDGALRAKLDAFRGKDPTKAWAWFVQPTHKLSQHDFEILTRQRD